MEQKHIGIIIAIIGLLVGVFVTMMKINEDRSIERYVEDKGSCYLDDGTCLHEDRDYAMYNLGWILSIALVLVGGYLIHSSRLNIAENNIEGKVKEEDIEEKEVRSIIIDPKEEKFRAFVSAFSGDERKVLEVMNENEGITQSTLRFKTGLSKAHLSDIIRDMEKKGIISRKAKGKTYELYIVRRY